jgi:signal transduction histidine kinase/DNA-binding NarL/FixJ family response regulator
MAIQQRIVRKRRQYNQWVASQTLEDFALRFTALRARKSIFRVGNTALGPVAFLAMEAIGGTITLAYGFHDAVWAMIAFSILMFLIGLPIAYYAAKFGVDIDLLTRGAGFGYLGSTITSLIYASFTFLLFAIEASILSTALQFVFGVPIAFAHVISAVVVIPIAIHGISMISRMQLFTQPVWLLLQFVPVLAIALIHPADAQAWSEFPGERGALPGTSHLVLIGMATSVLLSLLPQIGEQVDYLRFLPERTHENRFRWWAALLATGPGWIVPGTAKLLAGSFLAVLALRHSVPAAQAAQPTQMYYTAFLEALHSPTGALALTGVFVIVCQLKINVTNAYAGSIAWSNFFSRLTHSHPGRVVWLVFNVVVALFLMETGIFRAIEAILLIYANFAAGWLGALTADLVVNKPMGWSPPVIEFKRAHLYDINPVGVGALLVSIATSSLALFGVFGETAQNLSPLLGLAVGFSTAPLIAWRSRGRYYLAREATGLPEGVKEIRCSVCENQFETRDMAFCHAYAAPICSLCCTLEARCRDQCKTGSRASEQLSAVIAAVMPARVVAALGSRGGQFAGLLIFLSVLTGLLLLVINYQFRGAPEPDRTSVGSALWIVYLSLTVLLGVAAWIIVLAHESRRAAEAESGRQTIMLIEEIAAHQKTDAALQRAKEIAEAANAAKTRFLVGMSHEVRAPLNAIYGYAQLLERKSLESLENAVRVIRGSSEHLVQLIDGLLEISNIEIGLVRLNRDLVRLPDLLDPLIDVYRQQCTAKGIEFRHERAPRIPEFVHTDQKRLRQILTNLLSNAVKFTRTGAVTLAVRCQGEVVEFEVCDTGVGIAHEEMERIFEPFERGQAPEVRAVPGTGLGLTITKLLVHVMGGELMVDSAPGVGTRFRLRLHFTRALAPSGERTAERRVQGYAGRRVHILAVDDDPAHLLLVQDLLRPLDFRVGVAQSLQQARSAFAQERPDMVLLDLSLPDGNGWDFAREIRAQAPRQSVKIVIISANALAHEAGASGDAPDGFVRKPMETQLLIECVGRLLQLQWIYEAPPIVVAQEPATAAELATPQGLNQVSVRRHLDDLYQLGRIGHVRAVESKLRELEADDPASGSLAANLRQLIANFDLRQYMKLLDTLRKNG